MNANIDGNVTPPVGSAQAKVAQCSRNGRSCMITYQQERGSACCVE